MREELVFGPVDESVERVRWPLSAPDVRLFASVRWGLRHLVADLVTVFGAVMASYVLYLRSGLGPRYLDPRLYMEFGLSLSGITLFVLYAGGAYREEMGDLRIESFRRMLRAAASAMLLTVGLAFLTQSTAVARLTVLAVGPVVTGALVVQRLVFWALRERLRSAGGESTPVLVYGTGESGVLLAKRLLEEQAVGLEPIAFFDDDRRKHGERIRVGAGLAGRRLPILGGRDDILAVARRLRVTSVFVVLPDRAEAAPLGLVHALEIAGIRVFLVPGSASLFPTLTFGQVAGIPILTRAVPEARPLYEIGKRVLDVVGAATLLCATVPLFALGAFLVRSTSPGPVLFRQQRAGRRGRAFTMLKLRTMAADAPTYDLHPERADDPRITPMGAWLRRFGIDGLPQLLNVLRGDMSLVGPRAEMPFVVTGYDVVQAQRLAVKPGLTGLCQISGDRTFRIHDDIHHDLYYVENRSMLLDLAIVMLTPFAILTRNRAG
jgi:exopolysaccharide biosynthesis polyprenyl glycosylphosphotransferase